MQQYAISLLIFLPVLAAFITLLLPDSLSKSAKTISLITSIVQVVLTIGIIQYAPDNLGLLTTKVSWITLDLGSWGILKANYHVALDGLSLLLVMLSVFIMVVATISSWNVEKNVKGYFALLLLLNTAIIGCFTSLDLLLFYLFFEFMLLPMFFLIGIWGGPRREYASLKFFLYTLLGSIFILIAMIALYISVNEPGEGGKLVHSFSIQAMSNPINFISNSILDPNNIQMIGPLSARAWGFLLLFIGFAIKLPMVPFHTWLPDAHVEASTPISVILAALLLKVGGYGILRIAYPIFPEAAVHFGWLVASFGVISIIYGALNALASKDLKKLIAYSSVSHMGFVLVGLAALTIEGVTGAVYQMFAHGIITSMLFILVGVIYDRTHDRDITHYSGLASKMPAFFIFILIAFFASMGLPGFAGFIAEIMIFLGAFKSASENGILHQSFAIIATSGLILGAAYYLWTIQRMFFGKFNFQSAISPDLLTDLTKREYLMLVPLALAALVFGIFPQTLFDWINPYAEQFVKATLDTASSLTSNR